MFNGGASPSLADIAAVTKGNGEGDGLFGGNNGIWAIIVIIFALLGWGRNGFGNGNNGGEGSGNGGGTTVVTVPTPMGMGYGGGMWGGFADAAIQRGFDNQAVISKLDGINSGICSLGYDQLAQMNGIGAQITNTGFGLMQAIHDDMVANMQNANALSTQVADCCCKTQTSFMNVINQMDKNACALGNNVHQTGDAIINNQNQGFQMLNQTIKDGFCNLEMREMQRENNDLRQRLNNCDRDAALQGTASYIINSVRPTPIPAWPVANPWAGCNCNQSRECCDCGGRY